MSRLLTALGVERGVITLAGAGGKTSLLYRLADEAHASGRRVIVTTTTHMGAPKERAVVFDDAPDADAALRRALAERGRVMFVGHRIREDKTRGVSAERVDAIAGMGDLVLVEADGARRRSFKVPADHEPVVPASTALLVVVAGMDVLGRPLDEEHVHRVERVAAAAGQPIGSTVTEDTIVRALSDPSGYLSRAPAGARRAVFLNKVEAPAAPAVQAIARRLRAHYDLVLAGSARDGII